jgi:hypothetical protein
MPVLFDQVGIGVDATVLFDTGEAMAVFQVLDVPRYVMGDGSSTQITMDMEDDVKQQGTNPSWYPVRGPLAGVYCGQENIESITVSGYKVTVNFSTPPVSNTSLRLDLQLLFASN